MSKRISQREVIRRYERMLENLEPQDKEVIHNYYCKACKQTVKTIQVVAGTIPFKIICPNCRKDYATAVVGPDRIPNTKPTFMWYRPGIGYLLKKRKFPQYLEHVFMGGLDYAEIKKWDK